MGRRSTGDREGGGALPRPSGRSHRGRSSASPGPAARIGRQTVTSAAAMRRELDQLHVDVAVLFPDHLLSLAMVRDPGFAVALARAYNHWLADRWLRRRADAARRRRDRAAGPGGRRRGDPPHAGNREFVCVVPAGVGVEDRSTATSSTTPCIDAAQEAGLAGRASTSVEAVYPVFPFQLEQFRTAFGGARARAPARDGGEPRHRCSRPACPCASRTSDRLHGGRDRLGSVASRTGSTRSTSSAAARCRCCRSGRATTSSGSSTARSRSRSPSGWTDIVKLFELFDGENTAMFASDWPHHDFDHPQYVFGLPFSRRGAAEDHGPERGSLLRARRAA